MAFNLGSIALKLVAESRQFTRDMTRAEKKIQAVGAAGRRLGRVGLAAGVLGVGAMINRTNELNRQAANLSEQIQKDVEDVQALISAGKRADVSLSNMLITLRRIGRRASDAADGNAQMAATFAKLGIDAEAFVKLGLEDQVLVLARGMRTLEGAAERQIVAFKLLDTEGQTLLQLLERGPDMIAKWTAEARAQGVANRDAAEAAKRYQQRTSKVLDFVSGAFSKLVAAGMKGEDVVRSWGDAFLERLKGIKGLLPLVTDEQLANLKVQKQQNAAAKQERIEKLAVLDAEKKRRLLERTSSTMGREVNRRTTFLEFGQRGRRQEVRAPQLDRTNSKLDTIIGLLRNNTTGASVVFQG